MVFEAIHRASGRLKSPDPYSSSNLFSPTTETGKKLELWYSIGFEI